MVDTMYILCYSLDIWEQTSQQSERKGIQMLAKAQKWGNSLAVRLPKTMAEECGIEAESPVEIVREDNLIIIRPVRKKGFTLDNLLEGVTKDNIHSEVSSGKPAEKEIW
jgi:antitoxin MazE